MQAQAYQGYLENGFFHTAGKTIKLPERKNMFVTILEEANEEEVSEESKDNEHELRLAWLLKLETAIDLALTEDFPLIPRSTEMREPINLAD